MAKAPEIPATGARCARTAPKFEGPPPPGAPPPPAPPPPEGRGAVVAGRRAVEPGGAAGAPVLGGGAEAVTVDVVVSGTVDCNGDGPVARSRWVRCPPPPHA